MSIGVLLVNLHLVSLELKLFLLMIHVREHWIVIEIWRSISLLRRIIAKFHLNCFRLKIIDLTIYNTKGFFLNVQLST